MLRQRSMTILPIATFVLMFIFSGQPAQADWGISFSGEFHSPGGAYYGDRITSEYRRGYQVDDWIERGESSVTESPIFADGIRLASWATLYDEDYEYALASAIYFFEIPSSARSVRIKISYDGEADRSDLNGGIVGRVWVRRARLGDDYEEYYPSEGKYEDVEEPLYGDTFVLRSKKHLEIIRMSADDHTVDGIMELHVVAEGKQRIDVKYIEVETYSYLPKVRVITRYYRDYVWQPWYDYTYWYFYTGPVYHFADYYYVRYTYPRYRYYYVGIRKRYNGYLRVYYVKRPDRHVRWADVVRVSRGTPRTWDRNRLSGWTVDHEEAWNSYRITSMKTRGSADVQKVRTRVRSVLANHRQSSPATVQASSDRVAGAPSEKRREASASSSVRTRSSTDRSRSSVTSPARIETRSSAKTRRDDVRPSVRTRSSSSSQSERERSVIKSPSRSTSRERKETTRDSEGAKIKRETKPQTREVKRAPSGSRSQKQAPPKKVEPKKDDDDEDKDKEKSRSSSSSRRSTSTRSSTGSSSEKTRRGR
jgi:hypothetical protein